jgi:Leucine-rich repeat (LRR) protein
MEDRAIDEEISILEGLQPHPNLKCLRIIYYRGNISPTWLANDLNIKYLESLYLQDCSGWEVLPPLGQLPYLKKLHLIGMESILFIGSEFYGSGSLMGFPCLEELYFEKMPVWHSWYGVEEAYCFRSLLKLAIVDCSSLQVLPVEQWSGQARYRWFPRLSTLFIQNCPHLDQLPPLPHAPTLSRISLKNVGIISSLELDDEGIVISFMSNLWVQKQYYLQFQNLRRLKSFSISSCDNFVVLPLKGQGELVISEVSTTMHDINCSLSSINELRISGSGISEDILHEIFANAGILDCLSLKYCPHITSLELSAMMRLDYLVVEDCLQLTSLKCRQTLIHLRELNVLRSPKFVEAWKDLIRQTEGSSQEIIASLKRLHIDDSSFLSMSICRTLGYLQYLMIDSDQQIMSLTEDQEQAFCQLTSLQTLVFSECPSLCTLPARLHQISSLKRLDLLSCESINSLPHQGLPGSLETLFIVGCSQLRENCIDGRADQTKIAHVREIIL